MIQAPGKELDPAKPGTFLRPRLRYFDEKILMKTCSLGPKTLINKIEFLEILDYSDINY
jgi:hypothetical protein